jgi:hypothetical protein
MRSKFKPAASETRFVFIELRRCTAKVPEFTRDPESDFVSWLAGLMNRMRGRSEYETIVVLVIILLCNRSS